MSIARDRANRAGSDPLVIGASKISSNASDDLVVQDTSNNPKRLITSEMQIGDDDNDKIIIKRDSSTGKVNLQTVSGGGSPADQETAGLTVYANTGDLPASETEGVIALVTANNFMYIYRSGWYKVAEITNANPTISSAGNATYSFATDGTPVSIEVTASDPEGVPLQYKYTVTSGSLTNGGGATAAVTSSATSGGTYSALAENTLTSNKYFKITPSTNTSYAGDFSLTFHASDGVNVANSSASAFTLTFATYGSAFFDGNGDALTVASSSDFALGTGDFTLEAWVYSTTYANFPYILDGRTNPGSSSNAPALYIHSNNNINYYVAGSNQISTSYSSYQNKWTHIAIVRNSGTTTLYLDGVSKGTWSDSTNYTDQGPFVIGRHGDSSLATYCLNGYISNLRIVKGTAVYSSNFSTPNAPLTAITNTKLLTCQNSTGSITDASSSNHTITASGNTTASTLAPTKIATDQSTSNHNIIVNGDARNAKNWPFNYNG